MDMFQKEITTSQPMDRHEKLKAILHYKLIWHTFIKFSREEQIFLILK